MQDQIENLGSLSTTFLNNTTIPTYQEFSNENAIRKKKPPPAPVDLSSILTDDDSDEDDKDASQFINQKKNLKIIASPAVESFRTPKASRLLLLKTNTEPPRKLTKPTRLKANYSPDYVMCYHKDAQTSFVESPPPNNNRPREAQFRILIDDSLSNESIVQESPDFKNKAASAIVINDSANEEADVFPCSPPRPSSQKGKKSIFKSPKCKKRISMCGQTFNDDVLNIDDTILDEYENELDHKSGKLVSLTESRMERNFHEQEVISSTRNFNNKNESSSDELEKFLKQYRKSPPKSKKIDTLNDFIVDTDELSSSPEEQQRTKKREEKKPKGKFRRVVAPSSSSSEPDNNRKGDLPSADSESSDNSDLYGQDLQLFYIRMNNRQQKDSKDLENKTPKRPIFYNNSSASDLSNLSSDADSDSENRPNLRLTESDQNFFKTPAKSTQRPSDMRLTKTAQCLEKRSAHKRTLSFIESLSSMVEEERDPNAQYYLNKFKLKKVKDELLRKCFDEFNERIFELKIPVDTKLVWNGRLSSTAGYCKNTIRLGVRSSEIHISSKVCTTPERMRDTLAHEICHAACFIINKVNDGHGRLWKSWANLINVSYPKIPKITVSHSYFVEKKYIFECQSCRLQISRFSKSIDIEKEVCGLCHGRFTIIKNDAKMESIVKTNQKQSDLFDRYLSQDLMRMSIVDSTNVKATPRPLSKFAVFVKENYQSVKKENNINKHTDVMKELSKNFKKFTTENKDFSEIK